MKVDERRKWRRNGDEQGIEGDEEGGGVTDVGRKWMSGGETRDREGGVVESRRERGKEEAKNGGGGKI